MIEITKAYKTEDGQTFATLGEAQFHELFQIVVSCDGVNAAVGILIENRDKVIAILKLKPRKARTVKVKKVPKCA